jgi:hypothetical protein
MSENNDYAKILKGKYFDHLSSIYIEILDTWIRKTESLESVFMELLGRSMLEDIHAVKVSDVCSEIRKQVLAHCIGLSPEVDTEWSIFIENLKTRLLEIDEAMYNINQLLVRECTKRDSQDVELLVRGYEHIVSMNIRLRSLVKSYRPTGYGMVNNRLLLQNYKCKSFEMYFSTGRSTSIH